MSAPTITFDRPKYQPSGRVSLPWLLLSSIALFFVALIMGALLAATGRLFYIMIASPAIAAAGLAAAGYFLLRVSHCRSPALGALLLGSLGVVVYLFQFIAELAFFVGPVAFLRPDFWPMAIAESVNNWAIGKPGQNNANPVPIFNWIFFAVELFISGAIGVGAGVVAASPCYCERCRKWMSKKLTQVEAGGAAAVVQALASGTLAEMKPVGWNFVNDHATLQVEGCSHGGLDHEATFYLTACEVRGEGDNKQITTLAQNVLLTPEEFVLLIEKCPRLAAV
jgi:hypothetical protein